MPCYIVIYMLLEQVMIVSVCANRNTSRSELRREEDVFRKIEDIVYWYEHTTDIREKRKWKFKCILIWQSICLCLKLCCLNITVLYLFSFIQYMKRRGLNISQDQNIVWISVFGSIQISLRCEKGLALFPYKKME